MATHAGSWFGLPDFGVTEQIQKWISPNKPVTAQGGSNLFGGSSAQVSSSVPSYDSGLNYNFPLKTASTNINSTQGNTLQTSAPQTMSGTVDDSAVRNEISGAYDQYFAGLDAQLGTIGDQRTQQEGIVQSQETQGMNTLGSQKTQGLADLGAERVKNTENQVKTLQDLADNIKNQFQAGRLNLGARGAGDSSAANQYSYAIAKMGNKARGDVLGQSRSIENDIAGREFKLKNIYDTEVRNLKETVNQKMLEVANWFSQAQQQIQQMKAQGQLAKGQDLASLSKQALTMAQNQLLMAQQEAAQKRAALDTWAMNNSTTINQLKSNLANVSQYVAPNLNRQQISGQIQQDTAGNISGPQLVGYNSGWGTSQYDQYGNKIA